MNILSFLRQRFNAVIGGIVGAVLLLSCGALMAFVFAPQQSLLAKRIEKMPDMDAAAVTAAQDGADILVTGELQDNSVVGQGQFVAYILERWDVTTSRNDDGDEEITGDWSTIERVSPDLALNVKGQTVHILQADNVSMSGPLHEELVRSDSSLKANDGGTDLPDGSQRWRGLFNNDMVTVWGKKSASGVAPDEIYVGDRVAFAQDKHATARGLFLGGLCAMGLAPVALVGGILGGIFGRRRHQRP